MTRVVGAGLLASAFAPLVAVLALIRIDELGVISWVILSLCVASVLLLIVVMRKLAKVQKRSLESDTTRQADERVLAFTSSYIVPVVSRYSVDPNRRQQ